MPPTKKDWLEAREVLNWATTRLLKFRGIDPASALHRTWLREYEIRLIEKGERTQELYDDIMQEQQNA